MNKRGKAAALISVCIIIISLISISILEACYSQVQASSFLLDNNSNKVVVIMVDNIELQDFAENDYLELLFNNSYSALISSRQNGKASSIKAKLTLGSSKRMEISSHLITSVNYPISSAENKKQVLYTDIERLKQQNKDGEYISYIGYLGDKLNQYNKTSCLIGNSDTDVTDRGAVLLAMDQEGKVDYGDIADTTLQDFSFPGGKKTDYDKLLKLYEYYSPLSDLTIIDTGDLARLEYYKSYIPKENYKSYKKAVVEDIAKFTNEIINESEENTTIILLSTYPSKSNLKAGFKLTPVLVYENKAGGVLYSASTKREGIISGLDLADFLLDKLTGRKDSNLIAIEKEAPLRGTIALARRLLNVSSMRLPVLTWYAMFEIICATAAFLYMLNINSCKWNFIRLFKPIILLNILAPVVLLYMAALDIDSTSLYFGLFILFSLSIAAVLFKFIKTSVGQFLGAAFIVNLSIIIDLFRDSALMKNSIYGYDPIIGARFYGIGNEFAGVYIGSGILLAGCLLQYYEEYVKRKPRRSTLLLILFIGFQLMMVGLPALGANFGGTIAAVAGYYLFFSTVKQYKFNFRHLVILGLILIIALGGIIALDLKNPGKATHVGKFITDIKDNGVQVLYSTLARKASMNLKLIKYTIWTKVLLCIILIITIMFFKPVRILHGIFKKYKCLTAAWLGISAGSIAGLIANDSGIVMAATAMIFTCYTILYMCLEESMAVK